MKERETHTHPHTFCSLFFTFTTTDCFLTNGIKEINNKLWVHTTGVFEVSVIKMVYCYNKFCQGVTLRKHLLANPPRFFFIHRMVLFMAL